MVTGDVGVGGEPPFDGTDVAGAVGDGAVVEPGAPGVVVSGDPAAVVAGAFGSAAAATLKKPACGLATVAPEASSNSVTTAKSPAGSSTTRSRW